MILYAAILFAAAITFSVLAVMISKGRTDLINCYHEDRVKEKPVYCRKFGQALWIFAAVLAASGIVSLFGESDAVAFAAVGVLISGMLVGIFRLFYVQKKYGGGVF